MEHNISHKQNNHIEHQGIDLENLYNSTVSLEHRKKFGQFFTPSIIANYMADWIEVIKPISVLEPAIGTGCLFRALEQKFRHNFYVDGYDIDKNIGLFFKRNYSHSKNIRNIFINDFLTSEIKQKYDAVIMNPPYIKHQELEYNIDYYLNTFKKSNMNISRLSNIYVLFVIKACEMLNKNGRLAVIIPTEWTNANFGKALKDYLINNHYLRHILYFSNNSDVFTDALTTSCVLLIENNNSILKDIPISFLHNLTDLSNLNLANILSDKKITQHIETKTLQATSKWDYLIKYGTIKKITNFVPLSHIAFTKRGIATGANNFFHISLMEAMQLSIDACHLLPCIGKATDVKGFNFSNIEYQKLLEQNKKTHLIVFDNKLSSKELEYIKAGEKNNLHLRYLLSQRKPWYSMEKRLPAPIWAAVFGRVGVKFIYNEAMISNLTTFHGIYPKKMETDFIKALVVVLNSRIIKEYAMSNVRVYGGGLFKFEPKDLLDIQVPNLLNCSNDIIKELSNLMPYIGNDNFSLAIDNLVIDSSKSTNNSMLLV